MRTGEEPRRRGNGITRAARCGRAASATSVRTQVQGATLDIVAAFNEVRQGDGVTDRPPRDALLNVRLGVDRAVPFVHGHLTGPN
jgi:hypothetical protein